MKNLKELLDSYVNDSLSAPEQQQLNRTFHDAADFQDFRTSYSQRLQQQRQLRLRKRAFYGVVLVLAVICGAFLAQKAYKKVPEKRPVRMDIASVEQPMTTEDNFEKAYRQTLSNVRKDVKTGENDWKILYSERHFAEAAQIIEQTGAKATPDALYVLAICFIQQKRFDKAVAPLKRLTDSDPQQLKTFTPEARWLLANVYLKINRVAEARVLLQQFVTDDAPHAAEAKILLNKL